MDAFSIANERKENALAYTSFPSISELCCAICQTDFIEVHDSSSKSNFHWQIMKCRLLIHLVPDIIASPVSGTERFIFVVTHRTFFQTGKLEQILKNFKLVYQGVRSITTELYKSCLIFTIQTKIAPLWNKVGQYFLQGKEFYNSVEAVKALKLDILIEGKDVRLQFHIVKVKVPYIKLEDYLPSHVISEFLANPQGYIDLSRYNFPFIYVLPSIKKGKLLSVSKEIPKKSLFKDYSELRRHWKNMYGYFLPKDEGGILYYEIKFPIPESNVFTYPNLCIASGALDILTNWDKELTISNFVSDMLAKLPIVCGKHLQISKHSPLNTQTLNANLSPNILLQNQELSTHFTKNDDPMPVLQLEFPKLKKNIDTASSLKAELTKIHEIHSTSFSKNITNSNIDIQKEQDDTPQISNRQIMKKDYIHNNVSEKAGCSFTLTNEETVSRYFRIQKPHSLINSEEFIQEEKQKHLKLKEKLLKAKDSRTVLEETDENIDIEAMAKNSQLHHVKNSVLSNWLKKHSIPHNSKGKKTYLINKILSHIRNTQVLRQFRM